jgi:hypothetical protein
MARKSENRSVSVDVRKIENGYIIRESHYGNGDYKCSERFSPKSPKVEVRSTVESGRKGGNARSSSLGGAIGKLKE